MKLYLKTIFCISLIFSGLSSMNLETENLFLNFNEWRALSDNNDQLQPITRTERDEVLENIKRLKLLSKKEGSAQDRFELYMKIPKLYDIGRRKAFYKGTSIPVGKEAVFREDVTLVDRYINFPVDLSFAKFKQDILFSSITFNNKFKFNSVRVLGGVYLTKVFFNQGASFESCSFESDFITNVVNKNTKWQPSVVFCSATSFRFSRFAGHTQFGGAKFSAPLIFDHSKFTGYVTFVGTQFVRSSSFCENLIASFDSANFDCQAEFSIPEIGHHAFFTDKVNRYNNEKFEKRGLYLLNASSEINSGRFNFNNTRFTSLVYFPSVYRTKKKK